MVWQKTNKKSWAQFFLSNKGKPITDYSFICFLCDTDYSDGPLAVTKFGKHRPTFPLQNYTVVSETESWGCAVVFGSSQSSVCQSTARVQWFSRHNEGFQIADVGLSSFDTLSHFMIMAGPSTPFLSKSANCDGFIERNYFNEKPESQPFTF